MASAGLLDWAGVCSKQRAEVVVMKWKCSASTTVHADFDTYHHCCRCCSSCVTAVVIPTIVITHHICHLSLWLQELTAEQVVALVSCTVWQERAEAGQKVREDMQGPFAALTQAARTVAKVQLHPLSIVATVPAVYASWKAVAPKLFGVLPVLQKEASLCGV